MACRNFLLFYCVIVDIVFCLTTIASPPAWPEATQESKPWVYNWWMGSAVDEDGLEAQCAALEEKGFGGFHVIPIYGANGYESKYRKYLSDEWMDAFADAVRIGARHGLGVDLTTGSGWCFGGPQIDATNGCWKLEKRLDGKPPYVESAPTGQLVKRAGPGAEGLMMDPYSVEAMDAFLRPFSASFDKDEAARPVRMYHDSFEYYGAGWTPRFFELFKKKRGYDLKDHWESFASGKGNPEIVARLKCDYRETLSDLIVEDVFPKWVEWCRSRGIETRNEAHGAPANWLDFYALADCPETEMFGRDCQDVLISKFASSAAHVSGRKYVSAEACTWVNEHFCETPLDYKRRIDRLLLSGVNRIYYHGFCYSPTNAVWPGWSFYASSQTNPRNPLWRDFDEINAYVTRIQSLMQSTESDCDILVYWPIYDWWTDPIGFERLMSVHDTRWFDSLPFGRISRMLHEKGFQFDYVSDRQLEKLHFGNSYRTIVVPSARVMPLKTAKELMRLADEGFNVVFAGDYPETVPGFFDYEKQNAELKSIFENPPKRVKKVELSELCDFAKLRVEPFASSIGLISWRRKSLGSTYYFVVNDKASPVEGSFRVSASAKSIWSMDPMTGNVRGARMEDGRVRISLDPYESVIIVASNKADRKGRDRYVPQSKVVRLCPVSGPWTLSPVCGGPKMPPVRTMSVLSSWSTAEDGTEEPFCGTIRYRAEFSANAGIEELPSAIDLGKVCHTARVWINGHNLGCRFVPPYRFDVPKGVLKDVNEIEVEVTNLGANRIRWNDLNGVNWKCFHDINMISVKGVWAGGLVPFDASGWQLRESGLLGPVSLLVY